jgi:hypothetical protein
MSEVVKPNLKNFIKSLRDVGYNFHIALADVIDNSIAAGAKNIEIETDNSPNLFLTIFDNGSGMNQDELIEAMRLGSKDPDDIRDKKDLGRFGLGLKTASFSQCKRLTVISKKNNRISARIWDLDVIEKENEWFLLTPTQKELESIPCFNKLDSQQSGTLVVWEKIDGINLKNYYEELELVKQHLSLVFHRFLEGSLRGRKIRIDVNRNPLIPFNPFNEQNPATQVLPEQIIKIDGRKIVATPYILPHHSKLSKLDYQKYSTKDGYTKSQGFYLYRAGRLLIHGTWWGLNKISDAHRLVRVKIDITNEQDYLWNIDVKKSIANPNHLVKNELKKIMNQVLGRGEKTYTRRSAVIEDKTLVPFWKVLHQDEMVRFSINKEHPILSQLQINIDEQSNYILKGYLKGIEAYIPLAAIQAHMISEPHKINQSKIINEKDSEELFSELLKLELTEDEIETLMKTEFFKKVREMH